MVSFVDWYSHFYLHSGIRFVTPNQRHNGDAVEICRLLSSSGNSLASLPFP